jgi:HEAT repeat protein
MEWLGVHDESEGFPAAYALVRLDQASEHVIAVLFHALESEDPDRRWAALDVLTEKIPASVLIPRVLQALRYGSTRQRRMSVHLARCAELRSEALDSALLACLDADDPLLHVAAVGCLAVCTIRPSLTAERLATLVRGRNPQVARAAASALGRLGYRSMAVHSALVDALAGADASLRRVARKTLESLWGAVDEAVHPIGEKSS